ncbi:Alpha/Beta hydrolase protein [Aspergillus granulosus]|uniref:Alpha/Beta hydrolase protein n=1 Tax=Aspergillus granulosus TaxID=176169 RepID=A0ABR4HET9_9EURO
MPHKNTADAAPPSFDLKLKRGCALPGNRQGNQSLLNQRYSRPTAIIDSGAIVGTTTQVSIPSATAPAIVNKYLGIPFANKPERFCLTEPVSPWTGLLDVSKYGPGCYEANSEDVNWYTNGASLGLLPVEESEGCLNFNVWQGGGNFYAWYDDSNIVANQDVVVVAINYRMNVFGLPADESIPVAAALDLVSLSDYTDTLLEAYPLGEAGILTENARIVRITTDLLMQCSH